MYQCPIWQCKHEHYNGANTHNIVTNITFLQLSMVQLLELKLQYLQYSKVPLGVRIGYPHLRNPALLYSGSSNFTSFM